MDCCFRDIVMPTMHNTYLLAKNSFTVYHFYDMLSLLGGRKLDEEAVLCPVVRDVLDPDYFAQHTKQVECTVVVIVIETTAEVLDDHDGVINGVPILGFTFSLVKGRIRGI